MKVVFSSVMMLSCAVFAATLQTGDTTWNWTDLKFSPTVIIGPQWHGANLLSNGYSGNSATREAIFKVVCDKRDNGEIAVALKADEERSLTFQTHFKLTTLEQVWHRYIDVKLSDKLAYELQWRTGNGQESLRFTKNMSSEVPVVKWLKIVCSNGVEYEFETNGTRLAVQDNRKWEANGGFSVRLITAGSDDVTATVTRLVPAMETVDLVPYVNRAVADEKAEDGQGGWTDQGPLNDLRRFTETRVQYESIPFAIVPKSAKNGRQVVALAGEKQPSFPHEIEMALPAKTQCSGLALLHTSAWTPSGAVGELIIRYEDTGIQTIPVMAGTDIGNWWSDGDLPNAKIAWKADVGNVRQALYASCFELKGRRPVAISLKVTDAKAIWLVMGLTLLERPYRLPSYVPKPVTMKENDIWRPIRFERRVTPGSPLDFSSLVITHRPAGKYGRIIANADGDFCPVDRPDMKLRFNGVNLCETAIFLEKADAEKLAVFLAAQGINSVRFHHHDNYLVKKDSKDSTTIDPVMLDKMEYLVAQLKAQGIYITFDCYTSRKLREGDNLAVFKRFPDFLKAGHSAVKVAFVTQDDAFANWKTFVRNWLTHRNPYTGLTWLEDPVFAFVNLSNEDTITASWFHTRGSITHSLLSEAYEKYRTTHTEQTLSPEATVSNMDYMRFVTLLQGQRCQEMTDFLRRELKASFLITSCNFNVNLFNSFARRQFDVVDEHMYQAHPMFPVNSWGFPMEFTQSSVIAGNAWLPTGQISSRIYGKPFVMTEFNFCAPNIHRCEDGLLMGGYCGLNNVSAIYRFDFCCSEARLTGKRAGIILFESVHDPIMQFSDRIAAALFVRGDVAAAPTRLAVVFDQEMLQKATDMRYPPVDASAAITQYGVMFKDTPVPGVVDATQVSADSKAAQLLRHYRKDGIAVSETGQIKLNPTAKRLEIATPCSAAITLDKDSDGTAGALSVHHSSVFQTFAAISLDRQPLVSSKSIVILQSTDAVATGTRFADQDLRRQECNGTDPLLIRRGTADIAIAVGQPMRVIAVDFQGDAMSEIPSAYDRGCVRFKADNGAGVAAYHLVP